MFDFLVATSFSFLQSAQLKEIFEASPLIYATLGLLSIVALTLCVYCLFTFREREILPTKFYIELEGHLKHERYDQARYLCQNAPSVFAKIAETGLESSDQGLDFMIDSMNAEGKRRTARFWQRLSLLNDIAAIAPMFGLLGTVLGMFYAFYDMKRSVESIIALFVCLVGAMGTTVSGLIDAFSSMIFYTILKQRIVAIFCQLERASLKISQLIQNSSR